MDCFDSDYSKIYGDYSRMGLYDWVGPGMFDISPILCFDNKNDSWTKQDHFIAYETFFGQLRDDTEYNYVLKLPREEMLNDLKNNLPDTWEIYIKIIDFYSQR